MRYREPVLLGTLATLAVLIISLLTEPWQEAVAVGFVVAVGYIVHQGADRNGR